MRDFSFETDTVVIFDSFDDDYYYNSSGPLVFYCKVATEDNWLIKSLLDKQWNRGDKKESLANILSSITIFTL